MAARLFVRNRIRGVSFRHTRSATGAGRGAAPWSTSGSAIPWSGPSAADLRASAPKPFKKNDLHRLLADHGRQEIHTLVSDAVEQLGQLRQLSQSLKRFAPDEELSRRLLGDDGLDEHGTLPLHEILVEVMRVQRLWKLRLELLEMVVMAQESMRNSTAKPSKKHQPPVAKYAPRKK